MMSGTSQATFNKLQLPTDISEKALQNPDEITGFSQCI
jgi:hypothetical protein